MKIIVVILALFGALVLHLLFDLHKQKDKKPIVHWLSAALVVLISFGCGIGAQAAIQIHWYQVMISSLLVHLSLFDPIWNFVHGENILTYFGDEKNPSRAWSDRLWSGIPPGGQILFRGIFLGIAFAVFFDWQNIIKS